jgi:hypothetical protein
MWSNIGCVKFAVHDHWIRDPVCCASGPFYSFLIVNI